MARHVSPPQRKAATGAPQQGSRATGSPQHENKFTKGQAGDQRYFPGSLQKGCQTQKEGQLHCCVSKKRWLPLPLPLPLQKKNGWFEGANHGCWHAGWSTTHRSWWMSTLPTIRLLCWITIISIRSQNALQAHQGARRQTPCRCTECTPALGT